LDLVFLEGGLWQADTDSDVEGLLRFIPPAMFGPPEKCYYTKVPDVPGLHFRRNGTGAVAWFPWRIGTYFEHQGHAGHAALVISTLGRLLQLPRRVRLEAPGVVEINHRADRAGRFEWVSFVNHSGQMDKVRGEPLPIRNLRLDLTPLSAVKTVRLLKAGTSLKFDTRPGRTITCIVPELEAYEVILFEE
jgi:hypothetical protein